MITQPILFGGIPHVFQLEAGVIWWHRPINGTWFSEDLARAAGVPGGVYTFIAAADTGQLAVTAANNEGRAVLFATNDGARWGVANI